MRISTLVENTTIDPSIKCEHGLSQYIETDKHTLLFDTGQTDAFWHNAVAMGINLKQVDTLILSHGHYDHTGGVLKFAKINPDAEIYLHKYADGDHWNPEHYIGINRNILTLPHLHILEDDTKIDSELFIFSGVNGGRLLPPGNATIFKIENGIKTCDDFLHEQNLVISEDNKKILFTGCSHNGIVNILDRYREIFGADPDYVFGGFHLMKPGSPYDESDIALIKETAEVLSGYNAIFYTGHCTSQPAFDIMKPIMGDKLHAMSSGRVISI